MWREKAVAGLRLWWELSFPRTCGEDKHTEEENEPSVAEGSGVKLRRSVYGSSEPSGCPQRLLKMDGRVRPRLAPVSEFRFGAVATETIEDALLHLAQQNEQAVQESAGWMGSFRETRIVGVDAGPGAGFGEGGADRGICL